MLFRSKPPKNYNYSNIFSESNTINNFNLVLDNNLNIISAGQNNLFTYFYGFGIEKIIRKNLTDLFLIMPIAKIIKKMIETSKQKKVRVSCLAQIEEQNYICVCYPIKDIDDAEAVGFVFTKQDYTEIDTFEFSTILDEDDE